MNIGISLLNKVNDIKSTTYPLNTLSIKLPKAPHNINKYEKKYNLLLHLINSYIKYDINAIVIIINNITNF